MLCLYFVTADGRMTKQAQMWCKKTKQYEDSKKLSRESRPLTTTVGPCRSGQVIAEFSNDIPSLMI